MAKLDKMKFAMVVAHCVSNGMSQGQYEVEHLDELIDIDAPDPAYVSEASVNDLLKEMLMGQKIPAIKAYRVLTGAGLKEAKDAVEKYWVNTNMIDGKTLKNQMLNSLITDKSIVPEEHKKLFREFITSFTEYKALIG